VLASFIQNVVFPATEIDLAREVPDYCKVASDYYDTVGVFLEADLLSWGLKVLKNLLCFMEKLLLALFS
jgi:hypothetical protein